MRDATATVGRSEEGGSIQPSGGRFAARVLARSIVTFGQSADSASPHFFDQAPLYARGEFKDAWFHAEDVERAARRTYRPGPPPDAR